MFMARFAVVVEGLSWWDVYGAVHSVTGSSMWDVYGAVLGCLERDNGKFEAPKRDVWSAF